MKESNKPYNATEMEEPTSDSGGQQKHRNKSGEKKSNTPALDGFSKDITKKAQDGEIDPVIGRDKEIERVATILSRRKKNNVILIGDPGVGKTAIAEGLALKIANKEVNRSLFNKRIVNLDLSSLVAGTKYRGQFEERMKAIVNELQKNPDIITFIDEFHTIVGTGNAGGSLDAANMLKPALTSGEIQCIGATTMDEYRENIEKDGALTRRFGVVKVKANTPDETLQILRNVKSFYEDHHNVNYTEEALQNCVKLSDRYINERAFPDKALDVMDEAGARVRITNFQVPQYIEDMEKELEKIQEKKKQVVKSQQYEEAAKCRDEERQIAEKLEESKQQWEEELKKNRYNVTGDHVADAVSVITDIPVSKVSADESKKLLQINDILKNEVIGQNEAIDKITQALKRNRTGLNDPNRPIGSFILLGPTGVGKTETAKTISRVMFDRDDALIRVDMSEYSEKFTSTRLIGSPPGYVGHDEGGQLTEKVRRNPYSVVLLDEIEKAHNDIFNTLLQVLDDGVLTDGQGREVSFKNTVIMMTSNVGVSELRQFGTGVGFDIDSQEDREEKRKQVIEDNLKKRFTPEFLNRLDEIVTYNTLSTEDLRKIVDIRLENIKSRFQHQVGFTIELSDKAKNLLVDVGYSEEYGARPLNRQIQKYIADPLSDKILKGELSEGKHVKGDISKDGKEIVFTVKNKKKESTEK